MLALIPAEHVSTDEDASLVNASNQHLLRRFFVVPNGCEVTGLAYTPDHTTFFANIQHPSNWPASANASDVTPEGRLVRPRSATVVISKDDGGEVGL